MDLLGGILGIQDLWKIKEKEDFSWPWYKVLLFKTQVFAVDGEGQLNRVWQMQRTKDYSLWEHVEGTTEYKISSLPAIVNDASGWWSAFSVCLFQISG